MPQHAEAVCRFAYAETRAFYAEKMPLLGPDAACGFRILYGPPFVNAPLLFIGYQPGGKGSKIASEHEHWPAECDYAVARWPLAARLREIWGQPLLHQCVGLNAIFFRSPSMRDWRRLPEGLRGEIEGFCRTQVERIVRVLTPQRVVIIGLNTFHTLTAGGIELSGDQGVLVKSGSLWGTRAYGIVHLSGARVSRTDRDRIKAYFAEH